MLKHPQLQAPDIWKSELQTPTLGIIYVRTQDW